MKRSELKRKSALKPGRRKKRPSLAGFHEAVCADGACALMGAGPCFGGLCGHHYWPKQRLKDNEAAYVDPRNGVPLCVNHHAAVEARIVVCPRPPYLDDFLQAYQLPDPDRMAA
jgi:hypothetical protein